MSGIPTFQQLPIWSSEFTCRIHCINMGTKLLTSDEMQRIENLLSFGDVIKVACVARFYLAVSQRWDKVASGVVALVENPGSYALEIRFYDWNTGREVSRTALYREMDYRKWKPQFHSFHGESGPVGIAFASSKEAKRLLSAVQVEVDSPFSRKKRFSKFVPFA